MSASFTDENNTFDLWEFICCARCHQPFRTGSGVAPSVPFWLTECGHIVCNNDLSPDQSCTVCGTQRIQLTALHQRDLGNPMAVWFRSIPDTLESTVAALKFQQDLMASNVRYYRSQLVKYQATIRVQRQEIETFQNEIQALRTNTDQNPQFSRYALRDEPSPTPNANGKRTLTDASSPLRVTTPSKPDRLTIPVTQKAPRLSTPQKRASKNYHDSTAGNSDSPTTPMQIRQYAYSPLPSPRPVGQLLSHAQMRPIRRAQERSLDQDSGMPPPPLPIANRPNISRSVPTPSIGSQGHRQLPRGSNFAANSSRQLQPLERPLRPEAPQNAPILTRPLMQTHSIRVSAPSVSPMTPSSVSTRRFNPPSRPISQMRSVNPQTSPQLGSEPSLQALSLVPPGRARMPFRPEAARR